MKTKIFTQLGLGIMFFNVSLGYSQNILTDGIFSTTTVISPYYEWPPSNVWSTWLGGGVDANATVVNGVCNYNISSSGYSGSYTWEIQLVQAGFLLV